MGKENDFSRLEINLPGCLENYRYFRSKLKPETRLLVLVKANAYGHGAVEFARLMEKTYEQDMKKGRELTLEAYENRSVVIKIKESVSRLLSDIL